MIKRVFLLGLLFCSFSLWSQKTDENKGEAYYRNSPCKSSFEKIRLDGENNQSNVELFLRKQLTNLKDARVTLKLNYKHESPGGFHYSFTQLFNGVTIYQSEIKVNTDNGNTVHSTFDNSENTSLWSLSTIDKKDNSVIAIHPVTHQPVLTERRIDNHSIETLIANQEVVFTRDLKMYFCPPESLVTGKVFNPDPLTTLGQYYGGTLVDNNDLNSPWLDAQRQTVNFMANYNGSQFTLESPFVRIVDFEPPSAAPVTSANGQFFFDRSQTGFEDVNAFYHLTTIHNHIHLLGFGCADGLIDIDTHGYFGQDNSVYDPGYTPPRISYGTGGVDDAEDGGVCVHEYGHAVSEAASPNSNSGFERNSLDEAFGDYLAGSYARSLNTFNENQVFKWDGPVWSGSNLGARILNSTKVYPQDLVAGAKYQNSSIWSAVLWCLNGSIGRDATDSLILQTHYAYAQDILMDAAAELLIDADTLLTGGKYFCPIYNCLFLHGLNPINLFVMCDVGINDVQKFPIQFFNHNQSFSIVNTGLLAMEIELLNVNGQVVSSFHEGQAVFNYGNANLSSGIYLVNVRLHNAGRNSNISQYINKTFKWSKTE